MFKKAILGGDGAVPAVRMKLVQMLEPLKVEVVDCGHCADFPDAAKDVSLRVTGEGAASFGVLICGSGTGVSIAANKVPGIRAAFCHDHLTAKLAWAHNNANVLRVDISLTV
ncbi:hypothetical protein DIPPA_14728 [Diplonema papillatum]|nr:hypothetical protein DIPPA_14728 [Diplonema papillatum]